MLYGNLETRSNTNALFSIRTKFKSIEAFTSVRPFSVDAMTIFAQIGVCTFINVSTVVSHSNLLITFRADAHKGADQILAGKLTVVCGCRALVDVWKKMP